jgi:ethanolamine-phosphate cytidylyltransferase
MLTILPFCCSVAAVEACRWATKSIPHAPYVTMLPWISHYGCQYVVHGDDITSDSNGEDCYRFVKAAGRFLVVKRTPGISTTDLVGRMLLCTKNHFVKSVKDILEGNEGSDNAEDRKAHGADLMQRLRDYATDESGHQPGPEVWLWNGSDTAKIDQVVEQAGKFEALINGVSSRPGQRIVYVDGGFDLFSSGHIEFLRRVWDLEEAEGRKNGWYEESAKQKRIAEQGADYGPAYIIAGIHDDSVINHWKGLNYPIMNIFERGLCVLQCKVRIAKDASVLMAANYHVLVY